MPRTLRHCSLFSGIPDERRRGIERLCSWRTASAGETLVAQQSDSSDPGIFFLAEGAARIVIYCPSGREIPLVEIAPGGVFGEIASIDGKPRLASVVAVRPCLIATLDRARLWEVLGQNQTVAEKLLIHLASQVRRLTECIYELQTLSVAGRIYADLLRLAEGKKRHDGSALIEPAPVHSAIATRAGTGRETVSRTLGRLRDEGILKNHANRRQGLLIVSVSRLEAKLKVASKS